jgi:hypothetical protein
MQGLSWEEVGEVYGTSADAAEARFSHALRRARERRVHAKFLKLTQLSVALDAPRSLRTCR